MRMRVKMSNGGGESCSNHNGVAASVIWEEELELELGLGLVNLICNFCFQMNL